MDGSGSATVPSSKMSEQNLQAKIRQLETDLQLAADIGQTFIAKNADLEAELEATHKRYVSKVEKLEQELHSAKMRLECSTETEKSLSTELEHVKDQMANAKKECATHQAAQRRLQSIIDEKESASLSHPSMVEVERLQRQVRHLEEQLSESRQMNERLLAHDTSSSTSFGDTSAALHSIREQELQCLVEQLHAEVDELKAEKQALLDRLTDAEDRLRTTLEDLSAQRASLQVQEEESAELRAQLEALQAEQLDPRRRGNSLFSEVEDRRLKQERELLSMRTRNRSLLEQLDFLKEQVRQSRNQMALALMAGSSSKADTRQIRLLQESLAAANAEISRLVGALASQRCEPVVEPASEGNPLSGLLSVERKRVAELREERLGLLRSLSQHQHRQDSLLRELHEAQRKAEALEAQLLKAMVRRSQEQTPSPQAAGSEKKEIIEHIGIVDERHQVLRETVSVPPNVQANPVSSPAAATTDSVSNSSVADCKEIKSKNQKVTFDDGNTKENDPSLEQAADKKKDFKRRGTIVKPQFKVESGAKVVTNVPECKQQ